jgi:hypothetical protein
MPRTRNKQHVHQTPADVPLPPGWSTHVPTETERRQWREFWDWWLGAEPAVPPAPAAGPGRSNAPVGSPTGASTDTGTVTSSATNKQGSNHDTRRQPS